ncbi:glycerophosphodiester phosphodiesterase family protein [Ponticaulis sp.]|uniref:glycerophosphodiester phosphodiesterase family protein n=1 Tax=Ponticaulis sp. TaxID=2020902 RepID=UPI000C35FC90|nr:glycerophosphodiester phosphodiesterase family protein [Ponticaulis sp.]MAJ08475.1 glycerophosphodiester phosphodiesterase [Ponticaulis sp.]HBH91382.1 glycerophosphodiester phosphodiesterase [Hyphomonadaceae bacterium]HBJ94629.1 glycerophosphodiester phosphodiesterase [Hyphomonadaceae bacterium]|tara:strand:- start:4399 stop:5124 length:726 start_codon:yes stop_codon:yes gene_type:complete
MPLTFDLPAFAYAHRGLWSADLPENSLKAFKQASEHGFGAECDVHLSGDGVPMVFHDFTLERMTGTQGKIGDASADELQTLHLAGTGHTIPILSDVLSAIGDQPLLVELKADETTDLPALAAATLMCVAEARGPVAIMSFSPSLISICKQITSHLTLGLLADPRRIETPEGRMSFFEIVKDIQPDCLGPNISQLTHFKDSNLPLASWTVREEAGLENCRSLNAAPIFENLPTDLVRAHLTS